MSDPFISKRVAMRERRRENRKRFWLWVAFLMLAAAHVGIYLYFSEITAFIEGGRDAVKERFGESNAVSE